jgi:hypothetical protein
MHVWRARGLADQFLIQKVFELSGQELSSVIHVQMANHADGGD